jgi:hypothetical protein
VEDYDILVPPRSRPHTLSHLAVSRSARPCPRTGTGTSSRCGRCRECGGGVSVARVRRIIHVFRGIQKVGGSGVERISLTSVLRARATIVAVSSNRRRRVRRAVDGEIE